MVTSKFQLGTALLLSFLVACGGKSPSGDPGEPTNNPISADPVQLEVPISWSIELQNIPPRWVRTTENLSCNGAELEVGATEETFFYQTLNGKLYRWQALDCEALRYGGGHLDALGAWTFETQTSLPEGVDADPRCQSMAFSHLADSRLQITTNRLIETLSFPDFCLSEYLLARPDWNSFKGATTSAGDCRTVNLELGEKRASLVFTEFSVADDSYKAEFRYDAADPCPLTNWGDAPLTAQECQRRAEPDITQSPDAVSHQCIAATGFLDNP